MFKLWAYCVVVPLAWTGVQLLKLAGLCLGEKVLTVYVNDECLYPWLGEM